MIHNHSYAEFDEYRFDCKIISMVEKKYIFAGIREYVPLRFFGKLKIIAIFTFNARTKNKLHYFSKYCRIIRTYGQNRGLYSNVQFI